MRCWIMIAAALIAEAINPELSLSLCSRLVIGFASAVGILMDIEEFKRGRK